MAEKRKQKRNLDLHFRSLQISYRSCSEFESDAGRKSWSQGPCHLIAEIMKNVLFVISKISDYFLHDYIWSDYGLFQVFSVYD